MGTTHQPVQRGYFCQHNEENICQLELSWKLRETKNIHQNKIWSKELEDSCSCLCNPQSNHLWWLETGCLEFIPQKETLPAKQVSSHHAKARIIVFSEKIVFSFTESQTTCFITFIFFDSFLSKSEPALNWSWYVSRAVNFTRSQMQNAPFPPTAAGATTRTSHWLWVRNAGCLSRATAGVPTRCP